MGLSAIVMFSIMIKEEEQKLNTCDGEVIDRLMNEPPKCPHIVKDDLNS